MDVIWEHLFQYCFHLMLSLFTAVEKWEHEKISFPDFAEEEKLRLKLVL